MIFKKRRDPLREAIYAVYYVRNGISIIDVFMDRVWNRRNRLLQIAAELEMRGETFLAKKYASEIAKLDKIYSRLTDVRLVLERIATSLERAVSARKIEEIAKDVYQLLIDFKKIPESTIPELNLTLVNLEYSIRNILDQLRGEYSNIEFDTPLDETINAILEEARTILKQKLESEITPENTVENK